MINKFVIYRGRKKLSGFHDGDISGVFRFRTTQWYSFSTKEEALDFIKRIKEKVNDSKNVARWGRYAKLHQAVARNLKVGEDDLL